MLLLFLFLGSFIKIDVNVLNPDDIKPEQKAMKEIVSLAVTAQICFMLKCERSACQKVWYVSPESGHYTLRVACKLYQQG